MICTPCAKAGVENGLGQFGRAALLHGACEDPTTCPCQHEMHGVNWGLITPSDGGRIEPEKMVT